MKTINIAEAKHYLDTSMMQSLHEPITVTDQQKEIAVILLPEDFYQLLKAAKQTINGLKPKTLEGLAKPINASEISGQNGQKKKITCPV